MVQERMIFTEFSDIISSGKKYKIILADPPWKYGFFHKYNDFTSKGEKTRMRGAAQEIYDTMDIEELQKIPVSQIAEKNSVLLMWVTMPCLPQGLQLIESWGFAYKTCAFTWVKRNTNGGYFVGLGNYTRANAELCLLATRGKPLPRISQKVKSVIDTPIQKHSAKPNIVRDRILQLFGDCSRIELFSRIRVSGWDTFGNDAKLQNTPLDSF